MEEVVNECMQKKDNWKYTNVTKCWQIFNNSKYQQTMVITLKVRQWFNL